VTSADIAMTASMPRLKPPFVALWALLVVSILLSLTLGAVAIDPVEIGAIIAAKLGIMPLPASIHPRDMNLLFEIRMPRVVLACLVGGGLAVAGAALQGMFRNQLADPGLLGVNSGAALAVAATIVLGGSYIVMLPPFLRGWALPGAAFIGACVVTAIVYGFAARQSSINVTVLLLVGIAINALAGAGLGLANFLSEDQQLRDITFWLLGSLAGVTWSKLLPVGLMLIAGIVLMLTLARPLNAFLLGEREAWQVGFATERVKRRLIIVTALASGAAVSLTGMIGFVGLLVPHLARLLVGADHRRVLPSSALLGASLLLLADLISRLAVLPAELPIGIVTSLLGAPFFLWLLLARRNST